MTAAQVEIRIMEVFEKKIPHLVDIELLMSVHTALVKPNLAPDQKGIDGVILHRLFKNKPVYIRPSCELLDSTQMERRGSCATIIFIIFIIITYVQTDLLNGVEEGFVKSAVRFTSDMDEEALFSIIRDQFDTKFDGNVPPFKILKAYLSSQTWIAVGTTR